MSQDRGLKSLEDRVLRRDLCTLCGACASLCPYLRPWKGRMVKMEDCDLTEGRCFSYCPRIEVDWDHLHRVTFGGPCRDAALGTAMEILMARTTEPSILERAQTGGVVSALIMHALQSGTVNAAVLTRRTHDHLPVGTVVRDAEAVRECAGSSYVAGPTLEAFNRGPWQAGEEVALVGIPCQVMALAKMRASPLEKKTPIDSIKLIVGLFCTWALSYEPFMGFLRERLNGAPVQKMDITPPPQRLLKVTIPHEVVDVPIDEIRQYIRPTCSICPDMTSEFADISVGTVEGIEGWNTVIIRTDRGLRIFEGTKKTGLIETAPLPHENSEHLKEASLLKKKRALESLREREGPEGHYLRIPQHLTERILSNEPEVH